VEQSTNLLTPEAATDEPASSPNPDSAEPAGRHRPRDWDADLSRPGAAPSLTPDGFADAYAPVTTDAIGRNIRDDGFTPDRQRLFLIVLAACGVVADACRAAGISRDTAYNLRNRAEGAAFAIAWNAALLIARGRMDDELMSRAMNGVVERVYRNGELWGERHRHDNRLAMAVLTRLDRQAAGLGEGAPAARAAAREWDQFLDIVEAGGGGAEGFFFERERPELTDPPTVDGDEPAPGSETARLARLASYRVYGVGLPHEVSIEDLEPEDMEGWTEEQWDRAEYWGLLDLIGESEWPDAARNVTESETNGTCPIRQDIASPEPGPEGETEPPPATGLARVRAEYAGRFAPEDAEPDEERDHLWEDEDLRLWLTDYPPPDGFDGYEEGEWGDDDYRRALAPGEQAVIDADLAAVHAEQEAERAMALAAACAARDRAFGFAGEDETPLPVEPAAQSDNSAPEIREGDTG
jgi:hypothetical protein